MTHFGEGERGDNQSRETEKTETPGMWRGTTKGERERERSVRKGWIGKTGTD